jgi:hypothetical protein
VGGGGCVEAGVIKFRMRRNFRNLFDVLADDEKNPTIGIVGSAWVMWLVSFVGNVGVDY